MLTGKDFVERWKAKTQEKGDEASEEAAASAFLEALRTLNGSERVIQNIKNECLPMRKKLTKLLAKEITESGDQGRGISKMYS